MLVVDASAVVELFMASPVGSEVGEFTLRHGLGDGRACHPLPPLVSEPVVHNHIQ